MPAKKLRKRKKRDFFYKDMLPTLAIPLIMAIHLYGFRALLMVMASCLSAVLCELLGCQLTKQRARVRDCSSLYTGALLALMLPASSPFWLACVGSAFAVLLVKVPFGGTYSAPFSCTGAAFSFLSICWPSMVFAYPAIESQAQSAVFGTAEFVAGTSVAQSLPPNTNPGITAVELINAIVGSVPGAMGMTSAAIMLGVLVYLLIKRPKSFINAISFIAVCLIGAVITTAVSGGQFFSENSLRLICMRLFSGFTLCIAVFLVTEEGPSPKKSLHRFIYGAATGIVYLTLKEISVFEDAGCFAVLIVNALWPVIKKYFLISKKKTSTSEVIANE